jgi:DNA-binding transcriptional regulator YhcF (GntR family)
MYLSVDPRSGTPMHLQVQAQTWLAVAKGALRPGDRMPAVRELAEYLRISPHVVTRAYHELQAEGLIESRQRNGSFIAPDAPARAVERLREITHQRLREAADQRADGNGRGAAACPPGCRPCRGPPGSR